MFPTNQNCVIASLIKELDAPVKLFLTPFEPQAPFSQQLVVCLPRGVSWTEISILLGSKV